MSDLPSISSATTSLVVKTQAAVASELETYVSTGLITAETQKALSIAVGGAVALKQVATPVGKRHLERIDTIISTRIQSPVGRARETLQTIAGGWEDMRADFHKYRELFYEVRLRRARITKLRKQADQAQDEDDRVIMGAEADLAQAQLDKMASDVAAGEAIMQSAVNKVTKASETYKLICSEAGKEFTEEDFLDEEITSYLQTGFWHAAKTFTVIDVRHGEDRAFERKHSYADEKHFQSRKGQAKDRADNRDAYWRPVMKEDILAFFQALDVPEAVVKREMMALEEQRHNFDLANGNQPQSFAPRMDAWVQRMAAQFLPGVKALVEKYGHERLKRAASLLAPDPGDSGDAGSVENKGRRGLTL